MHEVPEQTWVRLPRVSAGAMLAGDPRGARSEMGKAWRKVSRRTGRGREGPGVRGQARSLEGWASGALSAVSSYSPGSREVAHVVDSVSNPQQGDLRGAGQQGLSLPSLSPNPSLPFSAWSRQATGSPQNTWCPWGPRWVDGYGHMHVAECLCICIVEGQAWKDRRGLCACTPQHLSLLPRLSGEPEQMLGTCQPPLQLVSHRSGPTAVATPGPFVYFSLGSPLVSGTSRWRRGLGSGPRLLPASVEVDVDGGCQSL